MTAPPVSVCPRPNAVLLSSTNVWAVQIPNHECSTSDEVHGDGVVKALVSSCHGDTMVRTIVRLFWFIPFDGMQWNACRVNLKKQQRAVISCAALHGPSMMVR